MNWLSRLLQILSGTAKDEAWSRFASSTGADFIPRDPWLDNSSKIRFQAGEESILLDSYSERAGEINLLVTRARSIYVGRSYFNFTIYKRTIWNLLESPTDFFNTDLGQILSDQGFTVKTNDVHKAYGLLSEGGIFKLVQSVFQPGTEIRIKEIKASSGQDIHTHELIFTSYGIIKETERLREIFTLISLMITTLKTSGDANDSQAVDQY